MIEKKLKTFSFEMIEPLVHYPEEEQIGLAITNAIEEYKAARKLGLGNDIMKLKFSIKELKFAKEHLFRVMNMDFTKPTKKMLQVAKESNIDLKDPTVIEEFKMI